MGLLISMFVGVVLVAHFDGAAPGGGQTVLSQIAHRSVGGGVAYGFVQVATTLILLVAANSAFNGFPRLLYFIARDGFAPRVFLRMGDRLAFTTGILVLAVPAALIYAAFGGQTNPLIPLFAIGVFLAFTLAQSGMVAHWWRHRGRGWRAALAKPTSSAPSYRAWSWSSPRSPSSRRAPGWWSRWCPSSFWRARASTITMSGRTRRSHRDPRPGSKPRLLV